MNRDYCRQAQMMELREFTDDLLNRVEELRNELKEYGGVHLGHVRSFFEDVDKLKEQRHFHNTEDE